jgi:peptide-methionine (S)-S-oxide reductase
MQSSNLQMAIFGGGCFWCTEAIFKSLNGVISVSSGYAGGKFVNPTYEQVSSGATGHAEVNRIEFDPAVIPFNDLLEIFFELHDPTSLNRQGNDIGEEYRSVIFYTTDKQRQQAGEYVKRLDLSKKHTKPIVTEIKPFTEFYMAESYHQNYYENNKSQIYCRLIISPKLEKLKEKFNNKLK